MQKKPHWIAVIMMAATAIISAGQAPQQIRSVGEFYARSDGFSGNVVVFRNTSIISNESYGLANIELGVPVTAKTRFAVGSLTKQFTATSILLLQEQGLLKTSDTLAQHYPATPAGWRAVTLKQLLLHTSGVPDGVENWGTAAFAQGQHSPEEVIQSIASKPLVFPPGSRMEYNNTGYLLLGLVIEHVSKQSYAEFLQRHFFGPLQMSNTGLGVTGELIHDRAYGYAPESNGLRVADPVPFSSLFAAGGLYSTGADVAKWMIALHGGRVLKPASYKEMTTEGIGGYGEGLRLSRQSGKTDVSHSGRVSGFAAETEYFPELRTGIIVLSNKLSDNVSPGTIALDTDLMHMATDPNAAVRALGGERRIDAAVLGHYTGTYRAVGNQGVPTVVIALKDDHLSFTPAGKASSTLIARDDGAFYMKEWDGEVEFHQDAEGSWLNIFSLPNETMVTLRRNSPSTLKRSK